ncbi:MAG: threonylcarbamoyl-AMP synthase [Clostridiales Family XIII bacterium]|jgi:L-threonylcarbamoyladenylate synthase|nr:threonylcarbamoyl-AMP synthase [Clostridiales Family XIII bacterium]
MKTEILDVSGLAEDAMEKISHAASVLRRGGLVAFPTETVYGLGANALDEKAVAKVYEAKGRPSDNPMIVHISRASDIGMLTPTLSPAIVKLADNFWPGPLTIICKKREEVPSIVTGGLDTVAIRLPDSSIAIELIKLSGVPIAGPSANLSGSPSPTKAEHVIADLDGRVDVILKGPDSRIGIESTVVDMTVSPPVVLRPGVLTADILSAAIDEPVELDPALLGRGSSDEAEDSAEIIPKSPGMKYKHYAPTAEMVVVEGQRKRVTEEIKRLKSMNERIGRKVGVILFEEKEYVEAAHDFYARLRELDDEKVDLILAGALSYKDGVGFAVMNRMMKSAGHNVVKV